MSKTENLDTASAIADAIRAKRERKTGVLTDVALLEASLLADIETFDQDAAERHARREQSAGSRAGMIDPSMDFPEIVPSRAAHRLTPNPISCQAKAPADPPELNINRSSLLGQLRQQAETRQRELHTEQVKRTSSSEAIDQALKQLFFFLHDFVQQLNIVKPAIPRDYPLIEQWVLNQMTWQEGFADYRAQSQSAGALVELVTFTYRLSCPQLLVIERDGPAVERLRTQLFDYGLPFTCKEFKNVRSYVERAEFQVRGEISVSVRWRADFDKNLLILETRNLERLGTAMHTLRPHSIDQTLLDEFARPTQSIPHSVATLAVSKAGGPGRHWQNRRAPHQARAPGQ